jgi:hypothetical protein
MSHAILSIGARCRRWDNLRLELRQHRNIVTIETECRESFADGEGGGLGEASLPEALRARALI